MSAVQIENIQKTYGTKVQALKGISFTIEEGDFFALLGANGAGKTTLIGILTGLVKKTGGKAQVFSFDLDKDLNSVKKQIGVVPQEFNFGMFEKVIDIIVNQAGFYGIPRADAIPRAIKILNKVGLKEKKDEIARNLSGGMKRRLMIARALIHNPRLLILDEPTAGVDVELRKGMWEYLQELNKGGTTILLTTHYLEEVEQLCNRAAIIKEGEIVKIDLVKNLLRSVDKETYIIDTDKSINGEINGFEIVAKDENTFEVDIDKNLSLTLLFDEISKQGAKVTGIRPKDNRLEQLFLGILNN
jgi:ABC-2 type transport system ATP-binding protein